MMRINRVKSISVITIKLLNLAIMKLLQLFAVFFLVFTVISCKQKSSDSDGSDVEYYDEAMDDDFYEERGSIDLEFIRQNCDELPDELMEEYLKFGVADGLTPVDSNFIVENLSYFNVRASQPAQFVSGYRQIFFYYYAYFETPYIFNLLIYSEDEYGYLYDELYLVTINKEGRYVEDCEIIGHNYSGEGDEFAHWFWYQYELPFSFRVAQLEHYLREEMETDSVSRLITIDIDGFISQSLQDSVSFAGRLDAVVIDLTDRSGLSITGFEIRDLWETDKYTDLYMNADETAGMDTIDLYIDVYVRNVTEEGPKQISFNNCDHVESVRFASALGFEFWIDDGDGRWVSETSELTEWIELERIGKQAFIVPPEDELQEPKFTAAQLTEAERRKEDSQDQEESLNYGVITAVYAFDITFSDDGEEYTQVVQIKYQ